MDIQLELDVNKNWALTDDQILSQYHDFIYKDCFNSNSRILLLDDNNEFICLECYSRIPGGNHHCDKCNKDFDDVIICENGYLNQNKAIYDVRNENLFVYMIEIKEPFKMDHKRHDKEITINKLYVSQEGLIDLSNNNMLSFKNYRKYRKEDAYYYYASNDPMIKYFNAINELYQDNLDEVCNYPLLKHSCLKEIINDIYTNYKDFLSELSIENTLVWSLIYKEREYLYKMGLKKLAIMWPYKIEYKKKFKDTFGIDKSYLPSMIKYDIDIYTLKGLQGYPTKNMNTAYLIGYIEEFDYDFDLFYAVGLKNAANYLYGEKDNKRYEKRPFDMFNDYIRILDALGMDLRDKRTVFPDDLKKAHDELSDAYDRIKYADYDEKVKKYCELSKINEYEDDKYIIMPAPSIESLKDESRQMCNCVRTYANLIADGKCQIYFMREKENLNKSLVTIEVRGITVVQARAKYNDDVPDYLMDVIDRFESNLKPVNI